MATSKETTLQINKFLGIDQFDDGTVVEPGKFFNLQNLYVKSEGELKAVSGVTNLTGAQIAGVDTIQHAKFLDSDDSLICFYSPNYTTIATPTGQTYATAGGSASTRNVSIYYIGAGNSYRATAFATQSIQANGLTVTLPTNIPDYIHTIHIYVEALAGGYADTSIWAGTFTRKNGSFASSITVPRPIATVATASPLTISGRAASYTATFGTGGTLDSGRIYYFGMCPWAAGKRQTVAFYNNLQKGYAIYLPKDKSEMTVTFDFLPYGVAQVDTAPLNSDLNYTHIYLSCGLSIEDGLPISTGTSTGIQLPVPVTDQSVVFDQASASVVDISTDRITVTGEIPDLAFIKLTTAGTPVTGLAANTYYWVRNPQYTSTTTSFQLSATVSGTVIDLTGLGVGNGTWNWKRAVANVKELPVNSDLWAMCDDLNTDGTRISKATSPRLTGLIDLNQGISTQVTSQVPKGYGAFALTSLPYLPSIHREILSNRFQYAMTVNDHTPDASTPSEFFVSTDQAIQSRTYIGRLWCVNNLNSPFYTNGYVLKPATVDATSVYFPITKFIEFFQDRLILSGGDGDSVTYSKGVFGYSDAGNPNLLGTSVLQSKPVRFGDESDIRGLAIYSQDLTSVGPQTFLIVGKRDSLYTWNGDTDLGAQQIDRKTGFAGPDCFSRTRFGPIFVGTDNVYFLQNSQTLVPMGDDIRNIIQGLSEAQLYAIQSVYHDEQVKIAYSTDVELDREIWMKFFYNNGGISKKWSGPHIMKSFNGQAQTSGFQNEKNYRISFLDNRIYRRDDPGSFLNDGALIQHSIRINRLGLGQDHYLKVINRVFLALRIVQDEEFDLVLETEDGSQSAVYTASALFENGERQLLQVWIPERTLARILSISIENASDGDISLFDISLLFQALKMRMIP